MSEPLALASFPTLASPAPPGPARFGDMLEMAQDIPQRLANGKNLDQIMMEMQRKYERLASREDPEAPCG